MGRPKSEKPTKPLEIGLPVAAFEALRELVKKGYGQTPTEVGRYLIQREIDDLRRTGVID